MDINKDLYNQTYFSRVAKVCYINVAANIVLFVIKLIGGILGNSSALINDSFGSFGDIATTITFSCGARLSKKEKDKNHPLGYEKIESLLCLIISLVIVFISSLLIYRSAMIIINKTYESKAIELIAITMIGISIFVKIFLSIYSFKSFKDIKSHILETITEENFFNFIGSALSLIALLIAYLHESYTIFDPIASICVSVITIIGALRLSIINSSVLLDRAYDANKIELIKKTILSLDEVNEIENIEATYYGYRVYLQVVISLDSNLTIGESNKITNQIVEIVKKEHPEVKYCMVSILPKDYNK